MSSFDGDSPPPGGSGSGSGSVVGGLPRLLHRLVELFGIQAGIVERIAATPVRQREFGRHPDVLLSDRVGPAPRSVRDRRPRDHQIGTHSVDVEGRAECGDSP